MSQLKPEYDTVDEFWTIAERLTVKYPEVFGGIDTSAIKCVAIVNKDRKPDKKLWEIRAVTAPITMDCKYNYYIIIYLQDWAEMDDKRKAMLIANILQAIPNDVEKEGSVNPPDLKDYAIMVRTFGVDYLDRSDIPDILNDDVNWRLSSTDE
ncbi:MAG: putative metallopeptidase [Phenylobacterium sp.]